MQILLFSLLFGVCNAQSQLERNVLDAMKEAETVMLNNRGKVKTMPDDRFHAQSQRANKDSHREGQRGDWLAETTKLMVKKYGAGILPQLEKVNVDALMPPKAKRQAPNCPADDENCNSPRNSQYRSVSGVCNNRVNKDWGKAVSPIRRLLGAANYEDGIGAYRTRSVTGAPLPSARDISNRLHSEGARPAFDAKRSHFFQQFGQWIAHDIIFTPGATGANGQTIDCSSCDSDKMSDNCAPIRVPAGDTYFQPNSCIRLTRSLNGQKGLGQRTQIDQNTHFLDLSAVYGSEVCEAAKLRSFRNGELLDFRLSTAPAAEIILPPQAPNDPFCQSTNPNFCFLAGDFRNSLHPGLIPLHSIYIRIHNLIAQTMKKLRPTWSDEQLFQEARRMNIALYQKHVYDEYLPRLLGRDAMGQFALYPGGNVNPGYNQSVNPSLTAEFLSAFRFGHSQVRNDMPRMTNDGRSTGNVSLGSNIFYADSIYERKESVDELLEGMIQTPAMTADKEFTFPIRNQMFEIRGQKASGVDLVATNIMRTRDAGLFPYNTYRVAAGLRRATSFEDLAGEMDTANINALKAVYAHVDDIDFYSGMLMERPSLGYNINLPYPQPSRTEEGKSVFPPDLTKLNTGRTGSHLWTSRTMLGRTGTFLLAEGFRNLKYGDRFFWEWNGVPGSRGATFEEYSSLYNLNLAALVCKVSNMVQINEDIFDPTTAKMSCSERERLPLNVQPFVATAHKPPFS